jgi:hypothetical protein
VTYGGDPGNRFFVLYWRCPLIRVSVIRGSTVFNQLISNEVILSAALKVMYKHLPIPVAQRFDAKVCGSSLAAGSNPAGGMDVCLL